MKEMPRFVFPRSENTDLGHLCVGRSWVEVSGKSKAGSSLTTPKLKYVWGLVRSE